MQADFISAFDDCINMLNDGQSLEACLSRYPQFAAELRGLLSAGTSVRRARPSHWESAMARERGRDRFMAAVAARSIRRRAGIWPRLGMVASILLLCGVVTSVGYAALRLREQATPVPALIATTSPAVTDTIMPSETPGITPSPTATMTGTAPPSPIPSPTSTTMLTPSPAANPSATVCVAQRPDGWVTYRVQSGDTLSGLAAATGITLDELMRVNCLDNPSLIIVGQSLFLPYAPPAGSGSGTAPTPGSASSGGGSPSPGDDGGTNSNDNTSGGDDSNDNTSGGDDSNDNNDNISGSDDDKPDDDS